MVSNLPGLTKYLSIDIRIRRASKYSFVAQFISPAGEAKSECKLPISSRDARRALDWVSQVSNQLSPRDVNRAFDWTSQVTSGSTIRNIQDSELDPIKSMGRQLFEALFDGPQSRLYRSVKSRIFEQYETGMLLRLFIEDTDPELMTMPWEFLFDGEDFVNLSTRSSLVRMPVTPLPAVPEIPITPPVRVVMASANPAEFPPMSLDDIAHVADRFSEYEVHIIPDATIGMLDKAIIELKPHIIHLNLHGSGHDPSSVTDRIAFCTDSGQAYWVTSDSLVDLLSRDFARLVCLGVPNSHVFAADLSKTTPAVLSLQGVITGNALLTFYESFYQAIAYGQPIATAVSKGRQAIDRKKPGSREWGLPVLYTKGFVESLINIPQSESSSYLSSANAKTPTGAKAYERELKSLQVQLGIFLRNLEALEKRNPNDGEVQKIKDEIARLQARIDEIDKGE